MHRRRRSSGRLAAIAAASIALLGATQGFAQQGPGSEQVDVTIATLNNPTPIAAGRGVVAWSRLDASRGGYVLELALGTEILETVTTDVRPRSVPFDVDVGLDAKRRTFVTYSRCRVEPRARGTSSFPLIPDYTGGRGCDLYAYDVAARDEVRLTAVSTYDGSEVLPTLSGGRIGFARVRDGRPVLLVSDVNGGSTLQYRGGPGGGPGPLALDLDGPWLGMVWRGAAGEEVVVSHRDGHRYVAASSPRRGVLRSGVGVDDGAVWYRTTCPSAGAGCSERYWGYRWPTAKRKSQRFAIAESADLAAFAHGDGRTYALLGHETRGGATCNKEIPCRLILEGTLEFGELKPR